MGCVNFMHAGITLNNHEKAVDHSHVYACECVYDVMYIRMQGTRVVIPCLLQW